MRCLLKLAYLSVFFTVSGAARADDLAPFKDKLFQHRTVMEARDENMFQRIDFSIHREVNLRDEIPVKKTKAERVDLAPLSQQREQVVKYAGGQMETVEVGEPKDAEFAVIFIHGGGGDKTLGADDWTFGGNFNRVKNLATRNHGVYYSPSVGNEPSGAPGVAALVEQIKAKSPKAKIVLACGSAGSSVCWDLADNPKTVGKLAGLALLGGAGGANRPVLETEATKAMLPIVYAHGSKDPVLPWQTYFDDFRALRKSKPDYPARYYLFSGGVHGTPIRTLDWRKTLNWIFTQTSKPAAAATAPQGDPVPSGGKRSGGGR